MSITAWCLLSLIAGIAKSEVVNAAFVVGGALALILIAFFVARPLLVRYVRFMDQSESGLQPYAIVVVYVIILGAAALTEWNAAGRRIHRKPIGLPGTSNCWSSTPFSLFITQLGFYYFLRMTYGPRIEYNSVHSVSLIQSIVSISIHPVGPM